MGIGDRVDYYLMAHNIFPAAVAPAPAKKVRCTH
jgi:hypothetical protein